MLWKVADSAARDLGWFCDFLPELKINKARMHEMAWRHWATATDLAGALVSERGLAWRTAHQIVGILVRLCEERGLGPADVTPGLLDEAAKAYHDQPAGLDQAAIRAALDPERFISSRTVRGGPEKNESLRQAKVFEEELAADEKTVAGIDARLEASARKLEEAVDAVIAKGK
jgi:argininosuccinate lyase